LTSQVRLIGFGASGMTGYSQAKDFAGLMSGNLRVGIQVKLGKIEATLAYEDFSDIPGLSIDGPQVVAVSWAGDGSMAGSQLVSFAIDPGSEPFLTAEVDYSDALVEQGFGSDGTLSLTTDAGTYSVNVADALVVDFRGLLPLDEPPPPAGD
jgi:hypothetical protein